MYVESSLAFYYLLWKIASKWSIIEPVRSVALWVDVWLPVQVMFLCCLPVVWHGCTGIGQPGDLLETDLIDELTGECEGRKETNEILINILIWQLDWMYQNQILGHYPGINIKISIYLNFVLLFKNYDHFNDFTFHDLPGLKCPTNTYPPNILLSAKASCKFLDYWGQNWPNLTIILVLFCLYINYLLICNCDKRQNSKHMLCTVCPFTTWNINISLIKGRV